MLFLFIFQFIESYPFHISPLELISWMIGISGGIYCFSVLALAFGMSRLKQGKASHGPFVSVVVATRDEEDRIGWCLEGLIAQDYPADRFEVIVVDDRSVDRTLEIARRYEGLQSCVQVLQVKEQGYFCRKKNALALGISRSRGEILLTTDSDCRPGPGWLAGMVRHFNPDVGMVAGHSPPESQRGLTYGVLALEALAKAGLAAGSIGVGVPLSCTGRNLAYRRSAFEAVGGFDRVGHIIGGDDVLLMRMIATDTPWKICYATESETIVPTAPGSISPTDLYHQKARHASKARHYGGPIFYLAGAIYMFHLLLLAGIPPAIFLSGILTPVGIGMTAKCAVDLAFLFQAKRLMGSSRTLRYFPLLEAVYIPYVVVFSILGGLKKFKW